MLVLFSSVRAICGEDKSANKKAKNAGTVPAFLGRVFALGPAKFKLTMVALGYLVKRLHDETLGCVSFLGGWLLAGSWVDLIHRDLVVA